MMQSKMRELCRNADKANPVPVSLDNVATLLFDQAHGSPFLQSAADPEDRYGLRAGYSAEALHNDEIACYSTLGPNERNLTNKILYSPSNLVWIVGGVGTGKTRFLAHFRSAILPTLLHADTAARSVCPLVITLDFLGLGDPAFRGTDCEAIQRVLSERLCKRVQADIAGLLSLEDELTDAWNTLITEPNRCGNPALDVLISDSRDSNAGVKALEQDRDVVLHARGEIRRNILANTELARAYVAAVLGWVRRFRFRGHERCLLVAIDNIDREPTFVQQALKLLLKPFARQSGVRTVVFARQSTLRQIFSDYASEPVDAVPHCGPGPLDVVRDRLRRLEESPGDYARGVAPERHADLTHWARALRSKWLVQPLVGGFFSDLCGNSVRRGLILAQSLIMNCVYNPLKAGDESKVRIADVNRALMIGAEPTYRWNPERVVENLFALQPHKGVGQWLKTRLLVMAGHHAATGVSVSRTYEVCDAFGYDVEWVVDGLNELMLETFRLLWCDGPLRFESTTDLLSRGNALLFASRAGDACGKRVFSRLSYIQEVMLDTDVPTERFGQGWDHSRIDERFRMLREFVMMLVEADEAEVEKFVGCLGAAEYRRAFGDGDMLSVRLLQDVSRTSSYVFHNLPAKFSGFVNEELEHYRERSIRARNCQERLFGME